MDVRLPNGTVIRGIPEGTSREAIQAKAIAAGLATEQDFAPAPTEYKETKTAAQQLAGEQSAFDAFNISMGRGLTNVGRGIESLSRLIGLGFNPAVPTPKRIEQETQTDRKALEALGDEYPISTTAGEIVGETLPFLPAGIAAGGISGFAPRVATTGLVGAAESGIASEGRGESAADVGGKAIVGGVIASALEASIPVLGRIVGSIVRRVKNVPDPLSGEGMQAAMRELGLGPEDFTDDALAMLRDLPEGADPVQALRAAQFRNLGLEPTRAQLSRSAADFQVQQEAAKTSGRIREALEKQEGQIANLFDDYGRATGGKVAEEGNSVIDTIINRQTLRDNAISDAYQAAKNAAPKGKSIRFENLQSALFSMRDLERATGGLPSAVRGFMKNRGLIDQSGRLITTTKSVQKELDNFNKLIKSKGWSVGPDGVVRDGMGVTLKGATDTLNDINSRNTGRLLSVNEAELLRQDINSLYDSLSPFGRSKLAQLKDALDSDVEAFVGEDVFSGARAAKAEFESQMRRAKVSKFDARKANLVSDVIENKINPDELVNQTAFSKKWRAEDIQQLRDFTIGDGEGLRAWNDYRAEVLQGIKDMAFTGPVDDKGFQAISRAGLDRAIERIGTPKLKVIFTPEELRFLKDLKDVTALREPVRGTALGRGPSAQAIGKLEEYIRTVPLAGALIGDITDINGRIAVKSSPMVKINTPALNRAATVPATAAAAAVTQPQEEK